MVEMTRKQIIDGRFTIECPKCEYVLYGDEPRFFVECDKCLKKNEHKINYLYGKDVVEAYPDGWSCISCEAEFTEKTIDVDCLYVIQSEQGTECLKCSKTNSNK